MSMLGEIENTKQAINRLQLSIADPRIAIADRLRMVDELEWERERLKELERPRLEIRK